MRRTDRATWKRMTLVLPVCLLAACGLCGCDEERVVLVDYTPPLSRLRSTSSLSRTWTCRYPSGNRGRTPPKNSVPSLTIRIPTEALTGIASRRAVLEVTTNAAEAEATSHPGQGVCNEDPGTGRINGWCGVSEAPTPDDGKFVTKIEFWIVP